MPGLNNRDRIAEQADQIAALLDIDPDNVMFDRHGVSLSPRQAAMVIDRLLQTQTKKAVR